MTAGEIAAVTAVSSAFGMLSSASRLADMAPRRTALTLMMNGGAVWIAAFAISITTGAQLAATALIGLGVGLAGSKVLEVVEAGAVAVAQRLSGKEPMTREDVERIVGDLRNDSAAAFAEVNVKRRRDREARDKRNTGQDERMDGIVENKAADHKVSDDRIQKLEDRQSNSDGKDR